MLGIGLIGAGRIGRIHAASVAASPRARLVAVADALPEAAREVAAAHGAKAMTAGGIIRSPAIDAVMICSPTDTHARLIEQAVSAGKAVFCEKPVDLSSARIRRCLDVVAKAGRPLMIGFNRRFDPHFAEAKRRVAAGEIGKVEMVTILSRDPSPPPPAMSRARAGSSAT